MKMKFLTIYRDLAGCKEIEIPAPADMNALIEELSSRYGQPMRCKILSETGELLEDAVFLVNGTHISQLAGTATKLTDADSVTLFSAVAGG